MHSIVPSKFDVALAKMCLGCPVCRQARRRQAGAAFWWVTKVEGGACPFCRAYERVYGRPPHAPLHRADPADPAPKA